MRKIMALVTQNMPPQKAWHTSIADIGRFEGVADVRDPEGFLGELNRFLNEKLEQAPVKEDVAATLQSKARALVAEKRWEPGRTEIQKGRIALLEEFESPHNLSPERFAKLSLKSRQQIYRDIASRRLLAISAGSRKQRIPDWQLNEAPLALTQTVFKRFPELDSWTVYNILSSPLDALDGSSPVQKVTLGNVGNIADVVLNELGFQ
ncbi:integrase [Xanthomonas euvesicatoria]|uniref:integrase n=1 Tax=Xanthomonas euvesicatoria TaxID=456327 RepID=UPI000F8ECAE6|nr:integrase [Xanthomonas euvesicatoria]